VSKGWSATREQFKTSENPRPKNVVTVSDFFDRIRETHAGRGGTLEEYFGAFRLIVSESFGTDGTKQKYDYRAGGRRKWLERVDPFARLEWHLAFDYLPHSCVELRGTRFLLGPGSVVCDDWRGLGKFLKSPK
jgi:hypothetical protein